MVQPTSIPSFASQKGEGKHQGCLYADSRLRGNDGRNPPSPLTRAKGDSSLRSE